MTNMRAWLMRVARAPLIGVLVLAAACSPQDAAQRAGGCGPDLEAWSTAGVEFEPEAGTLVRNAAELRAALTNPQAGTIALADGVWENTVISVSYAGSREEPLVIRAQTPGQVRLVRPQIQIGGSGVVVDGFLIEAGDAIPVRFRGPAGVCTNCRLTNSIITDAAPASTQRRAFVSMFGDHNRVDHNYFVGGVMAHAALFVETEAGQERYHRIDHNYIGERASQYPTWDGEAITIGSGPYRNAEGVWVHAAQYVLVEENYICSVNSAFNAETREGGEEVISIKSGHNLIYRNTLDSNNVRHGITSRFGDENVIDSNYVFGANTPESSGVALAGGRGHVVRNNYIQDVLFGGITFFAGSSTPDPNAGYPVLPPTEDAVVEHNTLVNCRNCLLFGYNFGRANNGVVFNAPPNRITLADNIVSSPAERLVTELVAPTNVTILNTFFSGRELGFSAISPAQAPGLWARAPALAPISFRGVQMVLPSAEADGRVIDQGDRARPLAYDIDRQCRAGRADIGAHEYAADHQPAIVTFEDVGPTTYDAAAIVYANRSRPACLFNRPRD